MNARKPRGPVLVPALGQRRIDLDEDADVPNQPADFSDSESQRVLDAAARAVARELGRQYARELFNGTERR